MIDFTQIDSYIDTISELVEERNAAEQKLKRLRFQLATECAGSDFTLLEAFVVYGRLIMLGEGRLISDFCDAVNISRTLLREIWNNETDIDEIKNLDKKFGRFMGFYGAKYSGEFPIAYQLMPREGQRCVYLLYSDMDELLYIGQSSNVKNRLKSHIGKRRHGLHGYIVFEFLEDVDILAIEKELIIGMKPLLNIEHNEAVR